MGIPAYIVVSRESQFDIYEVDYNVGCSKDILRLHIVKNDMEVLHNLWRNFQI